MIDSSGFRANVGIVILNDDAQVFWGRRVGRDGWQFPQGGIQRDESPEAAMYRELEEETGLSRRDVQVLGKTRRWLRYRLPRRFVRHHQQPVCIGQKQIWFIMRLAADEESVRLDASGKPEFDDWRWVGFWEPASLVVNFKQGVYRKALHELASLVEKRHGLALPERPW
jgi:putative (di)nucleoside polyphosphate hydrolase